MRRAVIDVGSNSVLTLVAEGHDGEWKILAETSQVTGLGKGTKTSGRLSETGIVATLQAVEEGYRLAESLEAVEVRAEATMAARIAGNTADFLARAAAQGTPIGILSGTREAELGFKAVADDPLFAHEGRLSIVDVGGHSTELVTADRQGPTWSVSFRRSFPIGALAMREGVWKDDSPGPGERLAAVSEIDDAIGLCYLPHRCGLVVTLGATGTNLVTIRDRIVTWNPDRVHGRRLGFDDVSLAVATLCALDDAGRADLPGIEPGREHTIHAGALILERFMHALGAHECTVSVRGWRHALLDGPAR